uniref:DNA 3'-5' helicase n=1 Tax=Candidatus Kentrum sp. TUN TaxID=2126343 RepID=A0A450ZRI7_9GAMM|nr:MAG: PD-(D/E)XK nuclease superfamily protein [Candidatus Kentron sp. TUN]
MLPDDQAVRDRALDHTRSFIVQAPAGSGKTGLLIQRYLTLLAEVESPEEIIAVTFTRKAVGEMRDRILAALDSTLGEPPVSLFERRIWELARKVMARDTLRGWAIRSYPTRLRIQTIDSLCTWITRQAPWRSRLGGEPYTVEDAEPFYRQAVHDLLEVLEGDRSIEADALACVLESLDNDLSRFQATLVRMLARRDQWLRHLTEEADPVCRRQRMTRALGRAVEDALTGLCASVPAQLAEEIVTLADYAGANLAKTDSPSPIVTLAGLKSLPGNRAEDTNLWQGLAALLLTQAGEWRSRYTQKEGFPPARDAKAKAGMKERIAEINANLSNAHAFKARLHAIRELPPPVYGDRQWRILDASMTVLRLAAKTLRAVFAEHGVVDFIEVSQGALAVFSQENLEQNHPESIPWGSKKPKKIELDSNSDPEINDRNNYFGSGRVRLVEEAPADPIFSPDYRIHHLLVDEFQDTSHAQALLFTRLTANWRVGDGRTLFLVGDPMQSIYRFREADVGLYLRAWEQGIGNIPLEALTLSVNFRSQSRLVEWINRTFPLVFPDADDPGAGAVRFTPSVAHKKADTSPGVRFHAYLKDQREQEADQVVALIQAAKRENPMESIAILVRARAHLDTIIPRLQAAHIRYRGVEIAPLVQRSAVQDLLALTRALLHPGDRIAWLSVLRAPWCGLTLSDLHALVGDNREVSVLERLRAEEYAFPSNIDQPDSDKGRLSSHGRLRAGRVFRVLDSALRHRARKSLRGTVEGVWIALGGPACIDSDEVPDVRAFFGLLEKLEAEVGLPDGHLVTEQVSRLYATPNLAEWDVEIMTIHKAKGLEFDTVILPGLARAIHSGEKPLLAWAERPTTSGGFDLVLAPMAGPGDPDDPVHRHLCLLDAAKTEYETSRLLYVAITRARRHLHLLGQLKIAEKTDEVLPPNCQSLLAHLWPTVASAFTASVMDSVAYNNPDNKEHDSKTLKSHSTWPRESIPINRLSADWVPTEGLVPLRRSDYPLVIPSTLKPMKFLWAENITRSVGILIHRILRYLAEDKDHEWRAWQVEDKRSAWRSVLRGLGISGDDLKSALDKVIQAVTFVIEDPRWHWIVDLGHASARNEYQLTGVVDGQMISGVIDRTFIDTHGIRWIIDYKTGTHTGGELAEFLDREQVRYRDQLARYADLFKGMESRSTWAGLYFPLSGGWRAWEIRAS